MGSEWPVFRLDELTDLIVDCPHSTPKWTDKGVIVLRSQYIKNGRLSLENPSFTTEAGYQARIKRAIPSGGDIILTREAPMGEVCIIPKKLKCCLGQRMVLLRANNDILDSKYLLYVLQSPFLQHQIGWNEGTGTTVSNIRIPSIKAFEIPTPELEVQKRISEALSVIDDKIQLNRETNKTLEQMAQALFKSWFVDFDPVIDNALAAANPIPEPLQAQAQGRQQQLTKPDHQPLPDDIRQLFPNEFEETETLGWVPKGWEIKRTEELAEKIAMGPFGSNLKVSTFVEKGIPIISGHHLKGVLFDEHKHKFITSEHAEKLKNSTVFPGDIIFTHAGNIGQVSLIHKNVTFDKFVISQRQFYLRPNLKKVSAAYLLYYFKSHLGQYKLLANASQVGVPSIARPSSHLKNIELVVPGMELLDIFDEQCNSIFIKLMSSNENIESLIKLRDTLLPKLISGELRLPEAMLDSETNPLMDEVS